MNLFLEPDKRHVYTVQGIKRTKNLDNIIIEAGVVKEMVDLLYSQERRIKLLESKKR